jgi:hypothetical protein
MLFYKVKKYYHGEENFSFYVQSAIFLLLMVVLDSAISRSIEIELV